MQSSWEINKLKRKKKRLIKKNKKIKGKILKLLKNIGIIFYIILIIYNLIYIFNNVFYNKKYIRIFNLYISTEKENSMSPKINKNSLIIGYKINNIAENDIVGYDIDNSIKYHRVIKIKNENGKKTYITKADNNYNIDDVEKEKEDIKSRIIIKIPNLGFIFKLLESNISTIIIIIVLALRLSYNRYKLETSKARRKKKKMM